MMSSFIEDHRIKPVTVYGQECDGVYMDERGAWLGKVTMGPNSSGRVVIDVERIMDSKGNFIPAPDNWRDLVVERL